MQPANKPPTPAASRSLPGKPLPLRVGFAAESAAGGLASAVDAVALGQAPSRSKAAEPPLQGLSALVVDLPGPGLDHEALRDLCGRARDRDIPVIGIRRDNLEPAWAGLADLETGAPGSTPELTQAPAVDIQRFNPDRFSYDRVAGFVAAVDEEVCANTLGDSLTTLAEAARFDPIAIHGEEGLNKLPMPNGVVSGRLFEPDADESWEMLHRRLGVLDHPSFHASELERAGWIAKLCAAGVPVVAAEISDSLAELLGTELSGALEGLRARDLADLDLRERASVALRRAALRNHSAEARWRQICAAAGIELPGRPMVSVVFATRRMSWLEHGIAQVQRQNYEPRELVVCLHGDEFPGGTAERIRSVYEGALKVIRVDGELTLGDTLNAGVEASEGELVTKMDDDDYYSTEHLWDLVLALEYAQADLVGKGAEFVYLQWIDLTMRRFMGDGESTHPRLAGGSMMARKGPLEAIGGWPSRSRGEDTWLVRNFKDSGRKTYRTHGFGYILNRHGQDHTWNTYVDYFLIQSQREWRGLRLDQSGIQ